MSKDIKVFLDYLSSQTGLSIDDVARETEDALASVVSKRYPEGTRIMVQIETDQGSLEIFRVWSIVADDKVDIDSTVEMPLQQALSLSPESAVDEEIFESIPVENLGRIVATQVKQHIYKIIREGQNQKHRERFSERHGEIIHGTVKKVTREYVIVELGENIDGIIYKPDLIQREIIRNDDKIKAVIMHTSPEYRNAVCQLSRTSGSFLEQLFFTEVPEIHEGSIEIKSIARDPGSRAKIAVKSNDRRVDPIGACIGMRGTRVQAVSNELNGERIDIILWDDNPAKMAIHALSPGEIDSITMNEEEKSMDLHVAKDQLAQVIGRNGQNIKLASDLLGWKLNIVKADGVNIAEMSPTEALCHALDVDSDIADILIREGYSDSQTITQSSAEALAAIEEFDEEIADALYSRATSFVLEETLTQDSGEDLELVGFGDLSVEQAKALAAEDISSQEDLAELSVDELQAIIRLDDTQASSLIMQARAPWFSEDTKDKL